METSDTETQLGLKEISRCRQSRHRTVSGLLTASEVDERLFRYVLRDLYPEQYDHSFDRGDLLHAVLNDLHMEQLARLEKTQYAPHVQQCVRLDRSTACPTLIVDGLSVASTTEFGSCRADASVSQGKWMYEVTLETSGVQQLGWVTDCCVFTEEHGVGDVPDSYAYDGKRVQKWNVSCMAYGVPWTQGDVIGCLLDLDDGTVAFLRNGQSLGFAFTGLERRTVSNKRYYPAVSLGPGERGTLNFGSRPFRHPVATFQPIEATEPSYRACASCYFPCLCRIFMLLGTDAPASAGTTYPLVLLPNLQRGTLHTLFATLIKPISHLLTHQHSVSEVWVPLLLELHGTRPPHGQKTVIELVNLLSCYIPMQTFASSFREVLLELATLARTECLSADTAPYSGSYSYIALAVTLFRVSKLRDIYYTDPRIFDKVEGLLTIKQPTVNDLQELIPCVWLDSKCARLRLLDAFCQERYGGACAALANNLQAIEDLQQQLCAVLSSMEPHARPPFCACTVTAHYAANSAVRPPSPHSLYHCFVEHIILKNRGAVKEVAPPFLSDSSVLACLFFCHLRAVMDQVGLGQELLQWPAMEMLLQGHEDDIVDRYLKLPRLQGSPIGPWASPLSAISHQEWTKVDVAVGDLRTSTTQVSGVKCGRGCCCRADDVPHNMDRLLLLFHLGPANALRAAAAKVTKQSRMLFHMSDIAAEMQRVQRGSNHWRHLNDSSLACALQLATNLRSKTWDKLWLCSSWKLRLMQQLTRLTCRLLSALHDNTPLFSTVPEFYVDSVVVMFTTIRRELPCTDAGEWDDIITVLVDHFANPAIANPALRDTLRQPISALLHSQCAIVERHEGARRKLMGGMLVSFLGSSWLSVTHILLRISGGSRFTAGEGASSGSTVLNDSLKATLAAQPQLLTSFLNKLYNIVNTTLTELNSAIKEYHSTTQWTGRSHQQQVQRKCAVAFDLAVKLLRLLEYMTRQVPYSFLRSDELHLTRLLEVVSFVMMHMAPGLAGRAFEKLILQELKVFEGMSRGAIFHPLTGVLTNLWMAAECCTSTGHTTPYQGTSFLLTCHPMSPPTVPPHPSTAASGAPTDHSTALPPQLGDLSSADGDHPGPVISSASHVTEMPSSSGKCMQADEYGVVTKSDFLRLLLSGESNIPESAFEYLESLVRLPLSGGDHTSGCRDKDVLQDVLDHVRAATHGAALKSDQLYDEDCPEEFLDPLVQRLMLYPVILPDSHVTLDKSTILRHLASSQTDPFTRCPLQPDMLLPNTELKHKIDQFMETARRRHV